MNYSEKAAKYICWFAYGTAVYLLLKYGIAAILPFIISFTAYSVADKLSFRLSRKTGINKRIYSAVIVFIFLSLLIISVFAIIGRLFFEAREFIEEYINDPEKLSSLLKSTDGISEKIAEKMKLSPENELMFRKTIDSAAGKLTDLLIQKAGGLIEKIASGIISGLPSAILFITVTVISTFYFIFSKSGDRGILTIIGKNNREKLEKVKNGFAKTVIKYVKAHLLMLSLSAIVLFIGFSILKIKYVFLVAITIAVLDMLPVIGIGTILIPWGIGCLIKGNAGLGFGLLAVFAITVIIRETAEPKIVGKCIGANPIITLISMYAGLKLFGFFGLIILPMLSSGIIAYLSEKNNTSAVNKRTARERHNVGL